ncbi:LysE family translocator [Thalassotalea sp. ND16A]|uniref:LysE family translocator n=1 Tax=Thalassotalea sp. ND16A TaxID=1535422 RepID=UPI00051A7C3D|nr:LysE family translocator [Thalassotalea sp. ND16A]KGJ95807.1 hypothetical protein ND16A_1342 [Thalassotalea sp. ND16A]
MELFLTILLFAFSSTITPGPNNVMIMTSGLNYGVKNSLPHLFGICLGFPTMVIIVGLGFGVLFEQYPFIHQIIKVLGIAYLLYLSWLIANANPNTLEGKNSKPFTFIQAFLFQWVNPKAWVMATGAIAAFTSVSGSILFEVSLISFAFLAVAFPCVGTWLYFGAGMKQVLQQEKYQRRFNVTMALLLVLSIVPVLLEYNS